VARRNRLIHGGFEIEPKWFADWLFIVANGQPQSLAVKQDSMFGLFQPLPFLKIAVDAQVRDDAVQRAVLAPLMITVGWHGPVANIVLKSIVAVADGGVASGASQMIAVALYRRNRSAAWAPSDRLFTSNAASALKEQSAAALAGERLHFVIP
jgi:hypothetical protein